MSAAEIITVTRTAPELENLFRYITDRVDEQQVRFLIKCGFQHSRGNTWTLSVPHRGAVCTDEEGAKEWGHEHQYSYDPESKHVIFCGDRRSEDEEEVERFQDEVDRYTPARRPTAKCEPPVSARRPAVARPRPEPQAVLVPSDPGYISADDFS